jgi:hypothetical protein
MNDDRKGGEKQMLMQPWLALLLADEHRQRDLARTARERHDVHPAPSFRRRVGHRIIAFGARIAAEQPLELARSR